MKIRRRQIGMWVVASSAAACTAPNSAEPSRGSALTLSIGLGMRTPAGTERAVAPLTPVFAGDDLALSVHSEQALFLGLVDHVEDELRISSHAVALRAGDTQRLPPESGRWLKLHGRAPRALIAVVGTRSAATAEELAALLQEARDMQGWDAYPVAFDPAYAVDPRAPRAPAMGLPRRSFILHGRQLTRLDGGRVRVSVPGDHRAVIAMLDVEQR